MAAEDCAPPRPDPIALARDNWERAGWGDVADGMVARIPHPTDGRTTLVRLTDLGRATVEDATVTLNEQVFGDVGMPADDVKTLASAIEALRRNAGDF